MNIYKGCKCDEWETPFSLLESLGLTESEYAHDVCANEKNAKCKSYWTKNDNVLNREWPINITCWMNPPYSQAIQFFEKASKESLRGVRIVSIYKATNLETKLWQDIIFPSAQGVIFLKGRTEYINNSDSKRGVPFGSALIFYNVIPTKSQMLLGKFIKLK